MYPPKWVGRAKTLSILERPHQQAKLKQEDNTQQQKKLDDSIKIRESFGVMQSDKNPEISQASTQFKKEIQKDKEWSQFVCGCGSFIAIVAIIFVIYNIVRLYLYGDDY